MTTVTFAKLTQAPESRAALHQIFDPSNVEACANYGGGVHCDPVRTDKKIDLWGPRGEDPNSPLCAYIISENIEPAAMINLGTTGKNATVIDRTDAQFEGQVLECSGIMVRDKFLGSFEDIAQGAHDALTQHKAPGYTKMIVTFSNTHPYQGSFWKAAGATALTCDNVEIVLGKNSLHPERFKCENEIFYECGKWGDPKDGKVSHDGWHDSEPCIDWIAKHAAVANVGPAGEIDVNPEL